MSILRTLAIPLLLSSVVAVAQRPGYGKMSPLVREACLAAGSSQGYGAKPHGRAGGGSITAFVKTDGSAPLSGCTVLANYGSLYAASIPISRLAWLSCQQSVLRIEAGRLAHTTMDTTALIVGATALHSATALPRSYTGKGVVVGVQDIGFDLTHPNFWTADMSRYRVKALWDQLSTDTLGSPLPAGRDYRDSLSLLALGRPRDGDTQTHGTHTAGIAAGSGGEGYAMSPYTGIAPGADLCFVCNATSDDIALIDTADYYKYTYVLDALGFKYIFDYAASVGKPCVINFSEGSQEDLRGDDKLYYEMLDSLVGPGRIIVASAGNEGGGVNYVSKPRGVESAELPTAGVSKTWSVTTRATGDYAMSLAFRGVSVRHSLADIVAAKDSLISDTFTVDTTTFILTASAYADSYDPSLTVSDWLLQSVKGDVGNVVARLEGADAGVEMFPVTAVFRQATAASGANTGVVTDNSHSVLSPGSAPGVICVGSTSYRTHFTNYLGQLKVYDHGTGGVRSGFSSVGPTWDGRLKPDVMAPGDNIISSYSSYYEEYNPEASDISSDVRHFDYNGRTYAWNSNAGTSMSSPVVAGVIALWLEADPRLTPEDCRDIIAATSSHYDNGLAYPNNLYGYGQIDALAGMRLAVEKATGIKSVRQDTETEGDVYSVDGRRMGGDTRGLQRGVYIIKGKKILIR